MRPALVLLLVVAFGLALVDQPRRQSRHRLVKRVYRHCDEVLGARKFENDRRVSRRRLVAFFSHDLANLLFPPTQFGNAAALPSARRMARYVDIDWAAKPWPQRYHRWDIRGLWLRWTSEAGANAPNFIEWLERGRPVQGGGFAQALGLEWAPGLFEHKRDWSRDRVRFDRTRPAAVPDDLDLRDEVNGGG